MASAQVVQVICVEMPRGRGVEGDPVRSVTQYYTFEGKLLFENDPCRNYMPIVADDKFTQDHMEKYFNEMKKRGIHV